MTVEQASVDAAMAVLDRFMVAFNSADADRVAATFNFPHVRFHSGKVTVFPAATDFNLENFRRTADADSWSHSEWDERRLISAGRDKVHFNTKFSRKRADGSVIASYRSIYIVTCVGGRWGIQARSSFAP
ncbi:MAG: hypothetical protein AB7L90_04010 [Hyphomicrobiaceae bacterium]